MKYTYYVNDLCVFRDVGEPVMHPGPCELLTRDGVWAQSTGPGFHTRETGDWELWLLAKGIVGDETKALEALGLSEPPEVPAIRSAPPATVAAMADEVQEEWRADGRDADRVNSLELQRVFWSEVEVRLRTR